MIYKYNILYKAWESLFNTAPSSSRNIISNPYGFYIMLLFVESIVILPE